MERRAAEGLKVCMVNKQISAERQCENNNLKKKLGASTFILWFLGFDGKLAS